MTKVVTLKPKTVNEPTIKMLEDLLALAKEGEIQSVACATINPQGYTSSSYKMAPGQSDFAMIGSLEYCKQRLLKTIEGRD